MPQIGPTLPPGFLPIEIEEEEGTAEETVESYGPTLPPDLARDEEEEAEAEVVGPLPETSGVVGEVEYERRLEELRRKRNAENKVEKREAWMTELPEKLHTYGLGARTFSKRGVEASDEDRSIWTSGPSEPKNPKMSAVDEKKLVRKKAAMERDKNYEEQIEKLNKNRSESLLDMHSAKTKAEKEAADKLVRRPFDREKDLKLINLSKRDKSKLKEEASVLTGKFSHGAEQKFL